MLRIHRDTTIVILFGYEPCAMLFEDELLFSGTLKDKNTPCRRIRPELPVGPISNPAARKGPLSQCLSNRPLKWMLSHADPESMAAQHREQQANRFDCSRADDDDENARKDKENKRQE